MVSNNPIRVIIADDHLAIRTGIRRMLSQKPDISVVGEAKNGQETLTLTDELRPDVLLLDIDMPDMNGVEVTRRLRKKNNPVSILIVSSYADASYIRMIMDEGVTGYLIKDDAPAKIVDEIRQAARAPQARKSGKLTSAQFAV
jgi:DNA-binding NarL/FixJ family response regulator